MPQKLKEQNIVLDPISVDGKRKYCDEQGCSEDTKDKPAPAGQTVFGDHSVQRMDTTDMPEMTTNGCNELLPAAFRK
jgi:hypothetical protein